MYTAHFDYRDTKYHGVNFCMADQIGTHDAGFVRCIEYTVGEIGITRDHIGFADGFYFCMKSDIFFCFASLNSLGNDGAVLHHHRTHG